MSDNKQIQISRYPYPEVQPRYAAYCVENGKTPDQMLSHDRKQWTGGVMCGYVLWIQEKIIEFRKQFPDAFLNQTLIDQDAFTEFLFDAQKD